MIADLKPGDRFRLAEAGEPDENGLTSTTIWEGTVTRVEGEQVFYGPNNCDYLVDHEDATWERLAPEEPKNLGAVIEFTNDEGEPVRVVRVGDSFENDCYALTWEEILEEDANPSVLHEGMPNP